MHIITGVMMHGVVKTREGKEPKVDFHTMQRVRERRGQEGLKSVNVFHVLGFSVTLGYVACSVFLVGVIGGCEWDDAEFTNDGFGSYRDLNVVVFEDAGLEEAVRRATGLLDGPLSVEECASLEELDASNLEIESLAGIEVLQSLERLNLSWNRLQNVQELRHLPHLKQLDISWNNVRDLEPLGELKYLNTLDVSWNGIDDLSWLAGSTRLSCLVGNGNAVRHPDGLQNILSLEALDLEDNPLVGDLDELFWGRDLEYLGVLGLPPLEDVGKRLRPYLAQLPKSPAPAVEAPTTVRPRYVSD